jgi:hypothetical protein
MKIEYQASFRDALLRINRIYIPSMCVCVCECIWGQGLVEKNVSDMASTYWK